MHAHASLFESWSCAAAAACRWWAQVRALEAQVLDKLVGGESSSKGLGELANEWQASGGSWGGSRLVLTGWAKQWGMVTAAPSLQLSAEKPCTPGRLGVLSPDMWGPSYTALHSHWPEQS